MKLLLIERAARLLLGIIAMGFLARLVSSEVLGIGAIALTIYVFTSAIATLGSDLRFSVRSSADLQSINSIIKDAYATRVFGSVFSILFLGLYFLLSFGITLPNVAFVIVASLLAYGNFVEIYEAYLISQSDYQAAILARFISLFACAGVKIGFGFTAFDPGWISLVLLSDLLFPAIIYGIVAIWRRDFHISDLWPEKERCSNQWKILFSFGKFDLVSSLASFATTRFDIIFVNYLFGASLAGLYSVYSRLPLAVVSLINTLSELLAPRTLRFYSTDKVLFLKRMRLQIIVILLISLVTSAVFVVAGKLILTLIFGAGFSAGFWICSILFAAGGFGQMTVLLSKVMSLDGFEKTRMVRTITGLIIFVAMSFVLGPHFGILGIATAVFIAQFVCFALSMYFGDYWKQFLNPEFYQMHDVN